MVPSHTDLSYFLEVSQLLNLSKAADNLGISQPSLTLAMRRIEEVIGTTILVRHKRGVTLTKAGKQLLAHARTLFQYWEAVKYETLATTKEIQGTCVIGCHASMGLYTLHHFMANLLEKHPKLEIKLKHDPSRKITEHVINLAVDVGIVANPLRHPDLVIKKIDNERMLLWSNGSTSQIQDLKSGNAVIICDPNLIQTQTILKQLKKQRIHYGRLLTSDSLEVIASLTESGAGIGVLPECIALSRKLKRLSKSPFFQDEICIIYRGENRDVKTIQTITQAIKEAFLTHLNSSGDRPNTRLSI